MPLLETRNVGKCYLQGSDAEVWALRDHSLAISRGSFLVLSGPSGCGKTTLLSLLGALARPTHGKVLWEGRDLNACSDIELARLRRRLGFVFQNFALISKLPLWENITYPLIPRGVSRAERFEIARKLLARFQLTSKLLRTPQELSTGEQQRIAVARALAGNPEVILADEPTSNLDRPTATKLLTCFQEFHATGGTLIISSHDPEVVRLATTVHELVAEPHRASPD